MGLASSCLRPPKAVAFEAPCKTAAGYRTDAHAESVNKPYALVPADDKQCACSSPDKPCSTENACKFDAGLPPVNGDHNHVAALATGQLSSALTATATTASLQSTFMSTDGFPHSAWDLGPPSTDDEQTRVQTLRALDILESVSQGRRCKLDEEADMVLGAIMQMFDAITAMLVLFDDTRIIIRNALGVLKPGEFPYRWSFCAYTLTKHRPQTLVVPDATKDVRFSENPFVRGAPGVRFYCGAPLVSASGHILGTICFADNKPHPDFDVSKCYLINNMAEIMVRQLERYHAHAGPAGPIDAETTALARVARTIECYESFTGLVDISLRDGWMLMYVNEAWELMCAPWSRKEMVGRPLQRLLVLEEEPEHVPERKQPAAAACFAPKQAATAGAAQAPQPPASAAGAAKPGRLQDLIRGSKGGEAEADKPSTAAAAEATEAAEGVEARTASSSSTSGICCTSRYPSATSTGGEAPDTEVQGDVAANGKLIAMTPTERRQWRQQQERRSAATTRDAWACHVGALRAGEEVELGRARILMEDGRPSTTVVRVTVRAANCHVLDAAVRMPVGVPHQLVLPTSILAAGAGDPESEPVGPEAPAETADGAASKDGAEGTPPVAAPVDDSEPERKPEPCYCIISLSRIDDEQAEVTDMAGAPDQGQDGQAPMQLLPPGTSPVASAGSNIVANGAASCLSPSTPSTSTCLHPPASDATNVVAAVPLPAAETGDVSLPAGARTSRQYGAASHRGGRPSLDAGSVSRPSRFMASMVTRGSQSQCVSSWAYGMEPFPGLKLGHLLGKGGYGRVFSAMWKGQRVAAKVISNALLKSATCVNGVTLEALLAQEIEHPYIVRTYKCLVRSYEPGERQYAGGMSARSSAYGTSTTQRTPSDRTAPRAVLPPGTPSVTSPLPAGPSGAVDVPAMESQILRGYEAGRSNVAVARGPSLVRVSEQPSRHGGSDAGALGAKDVPKTIEVAAALPSRTPAAAPAVAAAAAAPAASVDDFDSFDVGGEEAAGGMIDQLTSAAAPGGMALAAAASHLPPEPPSAISHLHHLIGTADRLSAVTSGAAAQSCTIATHGSISVDNVMASLAAQQGRTAPRVNPGVNNLADLFGPGPEPGSAARDNVFSTAAATAAAAASLRDGTADASYRDSTRTQQRDALPEGETWIVQEFCGLGTLQDAIDSGRLRTEPSRSRGQPHMPYILLTAQEVASAMACVHSRGYMHGDLSAVNVLLADASGSAEGGDTGRGFVAKVSDFGLAKHLPDPTKPYVSSAYGVITHCAPEVLKSHTQTPKADVYSFGVLMWQMYTGSRPWANMNRFQIFGAVTGATAPGLRFLPTHQPPTRYRDLTMRCLSYDTDVRPTFAEICEELRLMTYEAAAAGQLPV